MGLFDPERYLSSLATVNIQKDLLDAGLRSVLLDIDNTVRSRATHDIARDGKAWLRRAREMGVSFCLLSANWHADAYEFARELDMPIVAKACKPLPLAYGTAMKLIGAEKGSTVAVGDQVLTDVVGAHLAGIQAWLVLPLSEVDIKHTLVLRNLERMMIGTRQPEGAPLVMNSEEQA